MMKIYCGNGEMRKLSDLRPIRRGSKDEDLLWGCGEQPMMRPGEHRSGTKSRESAATTKTLSSSYPS